MSKNIHHSLTELVGHTPLVRLHGYEKKLCLKAHILAKVEYFNPVGSIKDRIVLRIIEDAEKAGKITAGKNIRVGVLVFSEYFGSNAFGFFQGLFLTHGFAIAFRRPGGAIFAFAHKVLLCFLGIADDFVVGKASEFGGDVKNFLHIVDRNLIHIT